MNKLTKTAIAAGVATVALTCAALQPASAADMPIEYGPPQYGAPQYAPPQYGAPAYGPPPVAERYVEERYVYTEPAPIYRPPALVPIAPPVVAYEAEPPVVVAPGPYYGQRRVYVEPGYRHVEPRYRHGPRPYHAGYGYDRGYDYGHRRW